MDIWYGPSGAEIDTYVWTGFDYDLSWNYLNTYAGYDFYLNGQYEYCDGDEEYDSGSASVEDTFINMPAGYTNQYYLEGNHEIYWEDCCGIGGDWECPYQQSLQTDVSQAANLPYIVSISPSSDSIGDSGQIAVTGYNVVDSSCSASPEITGGVSVSLAAGDEYGGSATLNYSISTTASSCEPDSHHDKQFRHDERGYLCGLFDQTPVINQINPNPWASGENISNGTITGSHFGTNPTVSLSDRTITFSYTPISDTQINFNASIPTTTPTEAVAITVTSQGYNGSGFAAGYPAQPSCRVPIR